MQRIADGNHRRFCAILSAEIDPDFASAFTYTQIHRVPDCVVFAVDARFWVVSDPTDPARMALDAMERYCAAPPDSPSALRRPSLWLRNELWIALRGPSAGEGIVGIGYSVDAALQAFDRQYMTELRPPSC